MADLAVTKTATGTFYAGQVGTYTLTVTNAANVSSLAFDPNPGNNADTETSTVETWPPSQ